MLRGSARAAHRYVSAVSSPRAAPSSPPTDGRLFKLILVTRPSPSQVSPSHFALAAHGSPLPSLHPRCSPQPSCPMNAASSAACPPHTRQRDTHGAPPRSLFLLLHQGLDLTFSSTQLRAPAEANRPGEHKLQLMAPVTAEYLPDGHSVHMAFSVYWPPMHWAQPLPSTPSQPVPSAQQPAALQLPLEGHLPAPAPPDSAQLSDQERHSFQPISLLLESAYHSTVSPFCSATPLGPAVPLYFTPAIVR
jgi:hypothetical protein